MDRGDGSLPDRRRGGELPAAGGAEILKLLKLRSRQWRRRLGLAEIPAAPVEPVVEEGVLHEPDTGTFVAVDPDTGEEAAVDPDTGEIEAVPAPREASPEPSGDAARARHGR
jgi:hypothetical protein